MIGWQCDQCETWTATPPDPFLRVLFDVDIDDELCDCDEDDCDDCNPFAEAHLCSYPCLAAWAMDEAIKVTADNDN